MPSSDKLFNRLRSGGSVVRGFLVNDVPVEIFHCIPYTFFHFLLACNLQPTKTEITNWEYKETLEDRIQEDFF